MKNTNDPLVVTNHKQRGINMVDLMMWLVIAAMLLATALQGISYYQKAAYIYQMQSDLSGAGSMVVSASSIRDGKIDKASADSAMTEVKWSADVSHTVELASSGTIPYLRATHPSITDRDAIYLFKSCGEFKAGVNIVPKGGNPALEACGVTPGGGTGGGSVVTGPSFNTLTWTPKTTLGNASWSAFATTTDGKIMIATKGTNSLVQRSTDGGVSWADMTSLPAVAHTTMAMSKDGSKIFVGSQNGKLYYSQDSGASFLPTTAGASSNGSGYWWGVSASDDGKVVVAGDYNGKIWVSKDSGTSWAAQTDAVLGAVGTWVSSAVSNDGTKITVGARNGYVYTSTGNGSWARVAPTGTASGDWYTMATNNDVQFAAKYDGQIWKSIDNGASWTVVSTSPTAKWRSLVISDDGSKIVAGTFDGALYVSKDNGASWTPQADLPAVGPYYGIGVSADGSVIVTGKSNGQLYVGNYGD
jgi:hypothetical protein